MKKKKRSGKIYGSSQRTPSLYPFPRATEFTRWNSLRSLPSILHTAITSLILFSSFFSPELSDSVLSFSYDSRLPHRTSQDWLDELPTTLHMDVFWTVHLSGLADFNRWLDKKTVLYPVLSPKKSDYFLYDSLSPSRADFFFFLQPKSVSELTHLQSVEDYFCLSSPNLMKKSRKICKRKNSQRIGKTWKNLISGWEKRRQKFVGGGLWDWSGHSFDIHLINWTPQQDIWNAGPVATSDDDNLLA